MGGGRVIDMSLRWHVKDTTHLIGGIQENPLEYGGWTHWLKCPYIKY